MSAVAKIIHEPALPVQYESACRALAECRTIDEAKYFDSKADALAAWAKIYNNDRAAVEAKRLKLHAYRRMGEIARELQPPYRKGERSNTKTGSLPGHVALLKASGLKPSQATAASYISSMTAQSFEAAVSRDRPMAPSTLLPRIKETHSGSFVALVSNRSGFSLPAMESFVARHPAAELANGLTLEEKRHVAEISKSLMLWMKDLHVACKLATWAGEA